MREQRSTSAHQQRQTKSQRTADDDDDNDEDDDNEVRIIEEKKASTNKLSSILDDVIQHYVWPLLSDNDAIRLMQVDHALCDYYEARAYGLKKFRRICDDAQAQRHFHHLTVGPIRIISARLETLSLPTYKSIFRTRPSLISLALKYTSPDTILRKLIAAFIDATPMLQNLEMYCVRGPLDLLIPPIINHKNINTLHFVASSFTLDVSRAIAEVMRRNNSVTELRFDDCDTDDDARAIIVDGLTHNTKLNSLELFQCDIERKTAVELCNVINRPNSSLTALDMYCCYDLRGCGDDCAVILSSAIHKLRTFAFVEFDTTLRGATVICNALTRPDARLQRLELSCINSQATSMICAMLSINTSLQHLKFVAGFKNKAVELEDSLKRNRTLTSLEFEDMDSSPDFLLPHLDSVLRVNITLLSILYDHNTLDRLSLALEKNRYIQDLHKQYQINKT